MLCKYSLHSSVSRLLEFFNIIFILMYMSILPTVCVLRLRRPEESIRSPGTIVQTVVSRHVESGSSEERSVLSPTEFSLPARFVMFVSGRWTQIVRLAAEAKHKECLASPLVNFFPFLHLLTLFSLMVSVFNHSYKSIIAAGIEQSQR